MYIASNSSSLIVPIHSIRAMAGGEKNGRDPWWQGEKNKETPNRRERGTGEIERCELEQSSLRLEWRKSFL
jgi:hypothetical protein